MFGIFFFLTILASGSARLQRAALWLAFLLPFRRDVVLMRASCPQLVRPQPARGRG